MYAVIIYTDERGREPIREYLHSLKASAATNKESRIKFDKIHDYIQALATKGIALGGPYIKHIEGEIWELRPLRDRIFFFCHAGDTFILLHHFQKKTQKTPPQEIAKAKRNMHNFIEREQNNEQA